MSDRILLGQRPLDLQLSAPAQRALAVADAPLTVEMELYFSCLIRKRVRFPSAPPAGATCTRVNERLTICFHPVMTRACGVHESGGHPELETFPIARPEAFLPKWLRLDYRGNRWSGEFGY
jgi:hypothetical protein